MDYKNISNNGTISKLIDRVCVDNVIKVYSTPDYPNTIIDEISTNLGNLDYMIDLIIFNYSDTESLLFVDPYLRLIDLNNKFCNSEYSIALISLDKDKNYLPLSLNEKDFSVLSANVENEEENELLKILYDLDFNMNDNPLYVLDMQKSSKLIETKHLLKLSKSIRTILQKDHFDIYIENLSGYKTIYMTQQNTHKFIFFKKLSLHEESCAVDISSCLNATLTDNFGHFSKTMIKNIFYYKSEDGLKLDRELRTVIEHLKFSKTRSDNYFGQDNVLQVVYDFIRQEEAQHLVLIGKSGTGKTSILSKVFFHLTYLFPNESLVSIIRHIGLSSDSKDTFSLLTSIIHQLSKIFDVNLDKEKMREIDKICSYFKVFLKTIGEYNKFKKIFLIIDSLDQLSYDFSARHLDWFPVEIPINIKILTSTINDDEFEYVSEIRNLMTSSKHEIKFINLDSPNFMMDNESIEKLLKFKLDRVDRKIQNKQSNDLLECFKVCKNLLFINLMIDQAIEWKSSFKLDFNTLKITPDDAIAELLVNIENKFEIGFAFKVIKYITLSKNGFNEEILFKIILHDLKVNKLSTLGASLKLRQILSELQQYFTLPNLRWFHAKFYKVCLNRYCNENDENLKYHGMILDCFKCEVFNFESKYQSYWIDELVYHAVKSMKTEDLKSQFLFNLNFIRLKIEKLGFYELSKDYILAIKMNENDKGLDTLYKTLLMILKEIEENIESLPGQMMARLCGIETEFYDIHLINLMEQCRLPDRLAIIPSKSFLARPQIMSPINCKILQKGVIRAILGTNNGEFLITTSDDCQIRIFFTHNFEFNRLILKQHVENGALHLTKDDSILYAWCKTAPSSPMFCLIEAFDFRLSTPLFQLYSSSVSPLKRFHELTNGYDQSTIWLVNENKWYQINGLNGEIEKEIEIPREIPKRNAKVAMDTYKNNLIISSEFRKSIVSINMKGQFVHKIFPYIVEGRRMLVLPNETLLISMSDIRPLKTGKTLIECYILICDPITLDILSQISVTSPLRLFRSSLDSKIVTGYSGSKIFMFNISERKLLHCLEHSKVLNTVTQIDDNIIVSATTDYKIYTWHLNSKIENEFNLNLFEDYLSMSFRFITDQFNTMCPLVLQYNIFKEINGTLFSIFLVYDLKSQTPIKECKVKNLDLLPIYMFKDVLFICFDYECKSFLFIDINNFETFYRIDSIEKYLVKQISMDTFILLEADRGENKVYLVEIHVINKNSIIKKRLFEWPSVEWSTINYKNLIYKEEKSNAIKIFDFQLNTVSSIDQMIDFDIDDGDAITTLSSDDGLYLVFKAENEKYSRCRLFAFSVEKRKLVYSKILGFDKIKDVFVIGNHLLHVKTIEENVITRFLIDLKSENNLIRIFSRYDIKEVTQKVFNDPSIYANSKYIWLTKFQEALIGQANSHVHLIALDKETLTQVSYIDTEFKLCSSNFRIINNGTAALMRHEKCNKFVILNLQSFKVPNKLEFSKYELQNECLEWSIDGF